MNLLRSAQAGIAVGHDAASIPLFAQKRSFKFFKEWTWNYKNKIGHKPRYLPNYRFDFRDMQDKEYTHKPLRLKNLRGRHPETGEKINQRIGIYKFDWFWVDYRRNRFSPTTGGCYEERILEVRRAPNVTPYVALTAGTHGRRWILATENMKAGDVVRSYNYIPTKMLKDYEMPEGDSWPVGALPPGTKVCNIQTRPDSDYYLSNFRPQYSMINAGCAGTILRQQGEYTVIGITKGLDLAIKRECVATLGRLSNVEHGNLHWGSMNMKRRWGIRQGEGYWHKKDGYCGRKIHPPKTLNIDPDKEAPPPISIPITMTRKDFCAMFGNAVSQPKLYQQSPVFTDKLGNVTTSSTMGRGRSNANVGKKGSVYVTPVDNYRQQIGRQESKQLLKNERKQRRRKESERVQKKGATGYVLAVLVIFTLVLAGVYLVIYAFAQKDGDVMGTIRSVPFLQAIVDYVDRVYQVWIQPHLPF